MRKLKIFVTVLLVYEFVILTILQVPNYCSGFFNSNFCAIPFRYFLMGVVVPSMFALFAWWMPEMSRPFCKKCECEAHESDTQTKIFHEQISKNMLERVLATALIMGIEKFLSKRPKAKKTLDDILKSIYGKKK